jgi:hypothetical protein
LKVHYFHTHFVTQSPSIMTTETFETLPTDKLQKRKRFNTIALYLVWLGAALAIVASLYRYSLDGLFPTETFAMAMIALLASVPVLLEKRKVSRILSGRGD